MSITENKNAFVDTTAVSFGLSSMFTVTPASSNPTYLVLTTLDRNEYTVGATGATGTLTGNGHTLSFSSISGDGRGSGIVFTYQASSGRYYNGTYGYFDQLTYHSSGSLGDVTDLSLFGTGSLSLANAYATNAYDMMQVDPSGYLGTATVVTEPGFSGTVPAQATPASIAAAAQGFVGQDWNENGCWVLCSTIAADAGAALPVQSTLIGLAGQPNGEWMVAFNGPAGQSGNWQSMVKAGEMVVIGTPGGGGHITTVVSGAGSTAMLVDNAVFVNGSGQVQNPANDGSSSDIAIHPAHLASQEWSGEQAGTVVIYELDTPIVTDKVSSDSLVSGASQSLASLFAATDPANKAITAWQVYNSVATDTLVLGTTRYTGDNSAATALTDPSGSLASLSLLTGSTAGTDTLEVRAFNGSYWGDWQSLAVTISATAAAPPPVAAPPVLKTQTPNQTWTEGKSFSLPLAGIFTDPQGEALNYTAALSGGTALPSWLIFNATNDTFSGTPPNTAATLSIAVTATDSSGLSATDTFSATVLGAPVVAAQTPKQTWTEGKAISLSVANAFTDPQNQTLSYTATLSGGAALPSWLHFSATSDTFSGTAPTTAQTLNIKVTATDTSGLATSETFAANVASAAPVSHPGITVTPTPSQVWADGQTVNFQLPPDTFRDALGLKMTFAAYQVSGPDVTSWLYFNSITDTLFGHVPATASGTVELAVFATDSLHFTAADLFNVTLAPSPAHTAPAAPRGPFGMGPLFDPPAPSGMFAIHS